MHLYTTRRSLAVDTPGTYQAMADIGYATIGVSGRHGYRVTELRSTADGVGLAVVLERVGYERIRNNWAGALEDVRTLRRAGGRRPVVAGIAGHPEGFQQVAPGSGPGVRRSSSPGRSRP